MNCGGGFAKVGKLVRYGSKELIETPPEGDPTDVVALVTCATVAPWDTSQRRSPSVSSIERIQVYELAK